MQRATKKSASPSVERILRGLTVSEKDASLDEKLATLRGLRAISLETSSEIDAYFLQETSQLRDCVEVASRSQEELKTVIKRLTAAPLYPAVLLGLHHNGTGHPTALVQWGNTRRVVNVSTELDPSLLETGDQVLLGTELNVVVDRSPHAALNCGETAFFERYTGDGRVVVKHRDQDQLAALSGALQKADKLRPGDLLRWDPVTQLAFERIERSSGEHLFLEETPTVTFAGIGGLEPVIEQLQRSVLLQIQHPELVSKYRLRPVGGILLWGPPGVGKTMLARAMANWLGSLVPSGQARFLYLRPSALNSMWYGQSEANYREAFRVARQASESDPGVPVVMFFDEIDSIAHSRGESLMRADDRVVTALAAELDGLQPRGNLLVMGATNRREALDPALVRPGRFGDCMIEVHRPGRKAAHCIFSKYLLAETPYATASQGGDSREQVIQAAVSRIYSANGEGQLATLMFRDGKTRTVGMSDLVSGASIAKITNAAVERACLRESQCGEAGVKVDDLLSAVTEEFRSVAAGLTPGNIRSYVSELPQDVDVVRVDLNVRKVTQPHRYLNLH